MLPENDQDHYTSSSILIIQLPNKRGQLLKQVIQILISTKLIQNICYFRKIKIPS